MQRKQKHMCGELPAGHYYVGDPCYVIRDNAHWQSFLDAYYQAIGGDEAPEMPVIFYWRGQRCFLSATNTGDGCYYDQDGNDYPVDAGLIGVVPVEALDKDHQHGESFTRPFRVGADLGRWHKGGKNIYVGRRRIRT